MFTGLIQDIGVVASIASGPLTRLAISTNLPTGEFTLGESIAVDGVCLSVVAIAQGRFEVEASPETLRRTTVGQFMRGARVHLERAMQLSDRLGGHMVAGHVDAVSRIVTKESEGGALLLGISFERALAPFLVEKGSVAVDGVSLTINRVGNDRFSVSLIPETQRRTTLANKPIDASVNLETDLIGKYVARMVGKSGSGSTIDENLLKRCGFV